MKRPLFPRDEFVGSENFLEIFCSMKNSAFLETYLFTCFTNISKNLSCCSLSFASVSDCLPSSRKWRGGD